MKQLIGKSKVVDVLPLLQIIANENGLKLSNVLQFKQARQLLETRYNTKVIK